MDCLSYELRRGFREDGGLLALTLEDLWVVAVSKFPYPDEVVVSLGYSHRLVHQACLERGIHGSLRCDEYDSRNEIPDDAGACRVYDTHSLCR